MNPPPFRFGAFIADGVKGKREEALPPLIQKGIQYHRWVDWQTDRHPAFLSARRHLRPVAGKYAGLFVDLWLDAILGEAWESFHPAESLADFEERFLRETLYPHRKWAPATWVEFLQALEKEHLLLRFARFSGMALHIERFIHRRRLPIDASIVINFLESTNEILISLLLPFWQEACTWKQSADTFQKIL
ncbi:MAG: ACP phosphodiesterase [Bacteroidia bacterium]|nr:ACP phosphodiesterase [Bacteroidia bacterium]